MKIVLIGAGSACFGRGQIADVIQSPELRGRNVTLSLVDLDEAALSVMTSLAHRLRDHTGSDVRIESTTDRRAALPGADYVIISVARLRMPLWEQDFRVPLAHGFRHCLGENGGPGALFHALRSFELVIPICKDVEELRPEALVLNFTNPEARVLHAICNLTRVNAAGICHGVFWAIRKISDYLQKPPEQLDITSAGMNHLYCILSVKDNTSGEDLLPRALAAAKNEPDPHLVVFRKMAQIFDVFTFPSDDHIGEYMRWGAEFMGTKWHYGIERKRLTDAGLRPEQQIPIADYASGAKPIDDEMLAPSGESTIPMICDIELNRSNRHPAVNVLNTQQYIANLPLNCTVEVPALVDGTGIQPQHVGAVPETFAAMMRPQYTIHSILTEAYRTRSRKLLLQALLLDPLVDSITTAEKMLDEMLQLQGAFLPEFT